MKKRLFCLSLLLSVLLCACKTEPAAKIEQPFTLYFLNDSTENGTLCATTVSMDVQNMTVEEIMQAYLDAKPPEGAKSAFVWTLDTVKTEESSLVVTFRGKRATKLQNYLAAACLSKTMTQIPNIETVSLLAPGTEEAISLSDDDILLEDTAMQPQEESITLYLPDADGRYLVRYVQTVEAMEASEKPEYIVRRLIERENSFIPKGTELLSVSVDGGLCRLNLSSEFALKMEKSFAIERLAIYSIVNSLTELPQITTVDIWIEGAPLDGLSFVKLPAGLERNEALIYSYDKTDAQLFLSCDARRLVAVPYQITGDETALYELIINALIECEGDNGAVNYIPEGTQLLSVRMEDTACIVDLSGEFLTKCESDREERLAVYSIVSTMCALDGIDSVEILVEGLEPNYRNAELKNVRQPKTDWYAEG